MHACACVMILLYLLFPLIIICTCIAAIQVGKLDSVRSLARDLMASSPANRKKLTDILIPVIGRFVPHTQSLLVTLTDELDAVMSL